MIHSFSTILPLNPMGNQNVDDESGDASAALGDQVTRIAVLLGLTMLTQTLSSG